MPIITKNYIKDIIDASKFEIVKMMDKTTVVACRLPNGFVIIESSSCVKPENYHEGTGTEICMKRIENRLYELEEYKAYTTKRAEWKQRNE